jgi:hypothetical protein
MDEMIWSFGQLEGNADWDDQFHSGESDIIWEKSDKTNGEGTYKMVQGPKDTHVFDSEGYGKHLARMQNGYRLFGKYYLSLWD